MICFSISVLSSGSANSLVFIQWAILSGMRGASWQSFFWVHD